MCFENNEIKILMKGRQIHKTGLGTVPSQCSLNIHDNSTQCNPGQNLVLEKKYFNVPCQNLNNNKIWSVDWLLYPC